MNAGSPARFALAAVIAVLSIGGSYWGYNDEKAKMATAVEVSAAVDCERVRTTETDSDGNRSTRESWENCQADYLYNGQRYYGRHISGLQPNGPGTTTVHVQPSDPGSPFRPAGPLMVALFGGVGVLMAIVIAFAKTPAGTWSRMSTGRRNGYATSDGIGSEPVTDADAASSAPGPTGAHFDQADVDGGGDHFRRSA